MITGNEKLEGKKVETTDVVFPLETEIKVTAKGRFYQGHRRAGRFFPLKKSEYLKMDITKINVWQQMGEYEWVKVN